MKLYINNKEFLHIGDTNLNSVIEALDLPSKKGIAIAVNEEIINKDEWETYIIKENDSILMITATQGG